MSNLIIKQRIFSWTDSYDVYDGNYTPRYFVRADLFSIGKTIRIFDKATGEEVGMIHQKVLALLKEYEVYLYGEYMGNISKRLSLFIPKYDVDYKNWYLEGDFFNWDFEIREGSDLVALISKKLLTIGDSYVLQIADSRNELPVLLVALAIDAAHWSDDN
ncbi:MAG: hypothetical protein IKT14_06100 [Clostridiales bacterium]|nr:hypothetical protein [Clostridiales bacterium]MBR6484574.1 hypothetical protein [Clostridiales bacterium]